MDFRPSEEQQILRRTVREFAEAEMRPHVMEWDEAQHFSGDLLPKLASLGLMGIQFAEQYGGFEPPAGLQSFLEEVSLVSDIDNYDPSADARNRAAAYELALTSDRNYRPGDQISYYITGTKKNVSAYENSRLAIDWDPQARDENVDYYAAKLDELMKKFAGFTDPKSARAEPTQKDLAL